MDSALIGAVDDCVMSSLWSPYHGYTNSGVEAAMQQVRHEFIEFIGVLDQHNLLDGRALQLGMGLCNCPHAVWQLLSNHTITIDTRNCMQNDLILPGLDTHSREALNFAITNGPYDVLFIDAGHIYEDVKQDHTDYAPLVRAGGIVGFHDAVHRPQHDIDHHVWRYLNDEHPFINRIGHEVGIAWYVKG